MGERARLLATSLALAAGAVASADTARAQALLAYDAAGSVYTIRSDGTGNRALFGGSDPSWSRDGSRMVFTGTDGALWSARADGTELRLVVLPSEVEVEGAGHAHTLTDARWSPSGRQIAFTATGEDQAEAGVSVIATVAADGTELRLLGRGRSPEWIARRRIAFTTGPQRGTWNRVRTMRRDGTRARWLVRDRKALRLDLRLSPDGRRLAFGELRVGRDSQAHLRVIELGTGRIRTVRGAGSIFSWTPGGRLAYVTSSPPVGGQYAPPSTVRSVRVSGAGRRTLFSLPYHESGGLWANALDWQPTPTDGGYAGWKT